MTDRELGLFLNWILKHYTTTNDGQFFGWADSMNNEVNIKDIIDHYKESQLPQQEISDEEIDAMCKGILYYGHCTQEYYEGLEEGAKWYREQLKQRK